MSDEIVSLYSLMESHLSDLNLIEDPPENDENHQPDNGTDVLLPVPPRPRLALPKFFPGNSPMKEFIAQQIAKTIKAQQRQKQQEEEEQQKLAEEMERIKIVEEDKFKIEEEMKKLEIKEEPEYQIDLTTAIIPQSSQSQAFPKQPPSVEITQTETEPKATTIHNISKLPLRFDKDLCLYKPWDPTLPCTTDFSHIVKERRTRARFSHLGKVLCSRLRLIHNLTDPYVIPESYSKIVRFDFKTKSPGDIYKELELERTKWKPKKSTRFTMDITNFI